MGEEALSQKAREALRHIKNWIIKFGNAPSVRDLMKLMDYKSSRSALILIDELVKNGFLEKKTDRSIRFVKDLGSNIVNRTVEVPLVGSVVCGNPMLAVENIEAMIPVSTSLIKSGYKYFLLKAVGNSMDEAGISEGDLVLVRQQPSANNGDKIVALIDDEATVKEFQYKGGIVTLLPRSSNPKHKPIILTHDFKIQGVVVETIPMSQFKFK